MNYGNYRIYFVKLYFKDFLFTLLYLFWKLINEIHISSNVVIF